MKDYQEYKQEVEAGFEQVVNDLTNKFLADHLEFTRETFLQFLPVSVAWPETVPAVVPEPVAVDEPVVEETPLVEEAPIVEDAPAVEIEQPFADDEEKELESDVQP